MSLVNEIVIVATGPLTSKELSREYKNQNARKVTCLL